MSDEIDHEFVAKARSLLLGGETGAKQWNTLREQETSPPFLANIDLTGASFSSYFSRTNLRAANFHGAILNDTDFEYTDLTGADFTSVTAISARFGGRYAAKVAKARFDRALLQNADFASVSLDDVTFLGADLTRGSFYAARCRGCDFGRATLAQASFERSSLVNCDFRGASLVGAAFGGGELVNTSLPGPENLNAIEHTLPTTIDWATIRLGSGNIPPSFLWQLGMPRWLAEASALLNPGHLDHEVEMIARRVVDAGAGSYRQTLPILVKGHSQWQREDLVSRLRAHSLAVWVHSSVAWEDPQDEESGKYLTFDSDSITYEDALVQLDEFFQKEPPAEHPEWLARTIADRVESSFAAWDRDCAVARSRVRNIQDELSQRRRDSQPASLSAHKADTFAGELPAVEEVSVAASHPEIVAPSQDFVLRLAAYPPSLSDDVLQALKGAAPFAKLHREALTCKWRHGVHVTVTVAGKHLVIDDAVQTFVWEGQPHILAFDIRVGEDVQFGVPLIVRCNFSIEGLCVARVRFEQLVAARSRPGLVRFSKAAAARTAFASYASPDKERVRERVAAIRAFAGIDVFLDRFSLLPGEPWKDRLEHEIISRDLFWLFWSRAAAKSSWVDWEWRTAVAAKREDMIQIQPLERAEVAPPPSELSHLHFGDSLLDI